jgi:hypothetical protein
MANAPNSLKAPTGNPSNRFLKPSALCPVNQPPSGVRSRRFELSVSKETLELKLSSEPVLRLKD